MLRRGGYPRRALGGPADWLWDFETKPMAEADPAVVQSSQRAGRIGFKDTPFYKTESVIVANPFGAAPATFSA